jgi:hypothetical protein
MIDDLTTTEDRAALERAIDHQMLLVRDATKCGLVALAWRRRARLKVLRAMLAEIGVEERARAGHTG